MTVPHPPIVAGTGTGHRRPGGAGAGAVVRLGGTRLALARAGWLLVAVLAMGLFVASLPAHYARLADLSDPSLPDPEAVRVGLAQLGLPAAVYAAYTVALEALFAAVYFAVAAVIFRRRADEGIALLVSLTFVTFAVTFPRTLDALVAGHPAWGLVAKCLEVYGWLSFFLLFYLFPDGRFVPRWTRAPAAVWVAFGLLFNFLPATPLSPAAQPPLLSQGGLYALWGSMVVAQVYRYRRVSGPVQRQQTKWAAFGFAVAIATLVLGNAIEAVVPSFHRPGIAASYVAANTLYLVALVVLPVAIGLAILRHRLWDIDVLINRTLVYGALTAGVVCLYVLVVGGLGALFQARGSLVISLLAANLVAVLFQPLRERLQRGVNHLLYGERDEPYAVLSRLGQRLEGTLAPDAVLPAIVQTVTEALKVPSAAITLKRDDGFAVAAAAGVPDPRGGAPDPLRLPLIYQQETVGELLLAPRAPGEAFSPADRRLLDDLARQAGVAAHAVRLTADLQRSRERLVTAREEERRRLRRDLHDGLGPQLAGFTIRLDVVRPLLRHDPDGAEAVVLDLKARSQAVVADIRRLVYALRPPALDELGLVAALRQQAAQCGHTGLALTIDAPESLPPLPAAVEVAAYRIAQEALTNVVRHAQARTCALRIALDEQAGALRLEVSDDGQGLPAPPAGTPRHTGVGLVSMRERAAELGGSCVIAPRAGGGTRVAVRLPAVRRDARDGGDEAAPSNAEETEHGQ